VVLFYRSVPVWTDPAFGRWIKRWMDAPDHPIPLHLSDQHGTFDQDPVARVKRGKMFTGDLGFR
jgi:hypothetical protein